MNAPDLLIVNGVLWSGAPLREADALLLSGGRIQAIGASASLERMARPGTLRLDARGATITPGLCDAHLHLVSWARARREIPLFGLRSRREAVEAVARHLAEHPGPGVAVGRGWEADGWEAPPDHRALDAVAPERPVVLHSKDFHCVWVNAAAMRRAGVGGLVSEPEGGRIERHPSGELTGVFREHAVRYFDVLAEPPSASLDGECVREAVSALLAEGVTAVHDFEGEAEAGVLRDLCRGLAPCIRVLMHWPRASLDRALEEARSPASGDTGFSWGAVKLFADGTLGSRTAALLEPYDGSEEQGLDLIPPDELRGLVRRAVRGGVSVAVHAIGDRAVRSALDAFQACGPSLGRLRLRPRIEHAQLVHDDDLPRFAALGVAASMQPLHCVSDRDLAERWWGSRIRQAYPWRALRDRGTWLAFGSDAPVEPPSVVRGLHAATTRERPGASGDPFVACQRIALDEALAAYTEVPARLAGWWPQVGRLAPGSLADVVIWSHDLHRLPPARLHEAAPRWTILEGQVRFDRASGAPASDPVSSGSAA